MEVVDRHSPIYHFNLICGRCISFVAKSIENVSVLYRFCCILGGLGGFPQRTYGLKSLLERSERGSTRKCALAPLGARG